MPRKQKTVGSNITARAGTLCYEYGKAIQELVPQYPKERYPDWLQAVFESGTCVYCGSNKISSNKTKGDHLFSVIDGQMPSQLHNFSRFTLPCCSPCNSSKNKCSAQVFMKRKGLDTPERVALLQKIDDFIQENKQEYHYDKHLFQKIMDDTRKFLQDQANLIANTQVLLTEFTFLNLDD
jgi:hypothetical protein